MRKLTAVVLREEGAFVATCPEVGTTSQGDTIEEALSNLKEATELFLEEFPVATHEGPAFVTTFEVEKIADS
jgi:predicted RNase H-like HicB family nuclease